MWGVSAGFAERGGGDRAFETAARLAERCVKLDQSLRPAGTDFSEACRTGNLS